MDTYMRVYICEHQTSISNNYMPLKISFGHFRLYIYRRSKINKKRKIECEQTNVTLMTFIDPCLYKEISNFKEF